MGDPETIYRLTEAEYLDLERKAEFKSEFFDGEMFAMADGSVLHSLIATNLGGDRRVTYDFARLRPGATEIKRFQFGDAIIAKR